MKKYKKATRRKRILCQLSLTQISFKEMSTALDISILEIDSLFPSFISFHSLQTGNVEENIYFKHPQQKFGHKTLSKSLLVFFAFHHSPFAFFHFEIYDNSDISLFLMPPLGPKRDKQKRKKVYLLAKWY